MKVEETGIQGVLAITPKVFGDARGYFLETFHADRYRDAGVHETFVQDNVSRSQAGVLRGLHLQHPHGQGKLVYVLEGCVFDVGVDVRVGSPTFGRHVSRVLDANHKNQLYLPPGIAHGFCVLGTEPATFVYKCTDGYRPDCELTVRFDDPALGIDWPLAEPSLSDKDKKGVLLSEIDAARLPRYEGRR